MPSQRKLVLVTVGTTKFDALIRGVDSTAFLTCLMKHGFTDMLVQKGNGAYRLTEIYPTPIPEVNVRVEDYLPNLASEIEHAGLVISHAGAGSIFESLTYQVRCTPDTIEGAISRITTQKLIQYQRGDARQIGRAIESLFGPALHPSL